MILRAHHAKLAVVMQKSTDMPLAGHPDSVCDFIVEALVDEYMKRDPKSRLNIQALSSHGMLMLGGVVDSRADFDIAEHIRRSYKETGYTDEIEPFVNIEKPSEDMGRIVVGGRGEGSAIVYGYASKETRERLPRACVYAHDLARRVDNLRRHNTEYAWLQPDGSVQVTVDGKQPVHASIQVQHTDAISPKEVQTAMMDGAMKPVFGDIDSMRLYINAAGAFMQGGFSAGVGASGQKVSAKTYGGLLPSGSSSFIGKDPFHPARSGLYMARYLAKMLVEKHDAGNALVKCVYTMGQASPVLFTAISGSGVDMTDIVKKEDCRPEAIVERFGLAQPIYKDQSQYNIFANPAAPWEVIE